MMVVERVLVLHRLFSLSANTQRDLLCHAENLSNSLFAGKKLRQKEKARRQEPGQSKITTVDGFRAFCLTESNGDHDRGRGPGGGTVRALLPDRGGGLAPGGYVHRACALHFAACAPHCGFAPRTFCRGPCPSPARAPHRPGTRKQPAPQ